MKNTDSEYLVYEKMIPSALSPLLPPPPPPPPPPPLLSPFGAYPNPFGLDDSDRATFHPVVIFPTAVAAASSTGAAATTAMVTDDTSTTRQQQQQQQQEKSLRNPHVGNHQYDPKKTVVRVMDLTNMGGNGMARSLATEEEREQRRRQQVDATNHQVDQYSNNGNTNQNHPFSEGCQEYTIGRYDEDRRGLYITEMFTTDTSYSIDGYSSNEQQCRTIHMGIDLGGPVGTPIYAFTDGYIHSFGYNPLLGDYGHVIVIQHPITKTKTTTAIIAGIIAAPGHHGDVGGATDTDRTNDLLDRGRRVVVVYALYGHLDGGSIMNKQVGQPVFKGQVIGRMGDIHENGGWLNPHVHFQLSVLPPATHDMPGAVTTSDRDRALWDYPDPRYVLGPIY